jgi:branched-chain amino acid transport system substrate-binding protein
VRRLTAGGVLLSRGGAPARRCAGRWAVIQVPGLDSLRSRNAPGGEPRSGRARVLRTTCLTVLCLGAGLLAGCPGCLGGTQADSPVVLGLIAYQPEPIGADFGIQMVQAAKLAADEVNRNGGLILGGARRYVKLAIEISPATPEAAVAAAQRLINQENVAAIVGPHWSREALPVSDLVEQSRIPLISTGSTHPKTTNGKRYVFRIPFTDALQGRALATLARKELKAATAAIMIDASDPYATELTSIFAHVFEGGGGQIVASETYTPDAKVDYHAQLRRIHAYQPDVLLLPNRADDSKAQVRQARALGITATVLGSDNWRPEDVTNDMEGAYFTGPERLHERRLAALAAAFGRAYDAPPGVEAVETYDAFGVIFAAIRFSGDTTPDAIRDGLYKMGPYEGVTGDIDYVKDGSPTRSVVILHVLHGKAVWHRELRGEPSP